jgi:hypothetical protein
MLILCDGTDGAGKSTLATRLTEYLERHRPGDTVELWHAGKPTTHPLDEYVTPLLGYRPGRGHHIICDRWHWGETVYPVIKGRPTDLDRPTHRYTELFLQTRGALGVHVWRDVHELQAVFRDRGEFILTDAELHETQKLFTVAYNDSTITKRTIRPDEADVVEYIVAEAARAELKARSVASLVTYVGPPQADTLLLGDVRCPGNHNPAGPAFTPYPATSGAFLMRALHESGMAETLTGGLGIANACDVDSVADLVASVRPYAVVTLGANAWKTYTGAFGTEGVGAVPHPQYVRRFHHKHCADYGAAISEASYYRRDMRSWRP